MLTFDFLESDVSAAMKCSPLISLRVCHLAMGRRGVASMSDQWRSSAPFAMHPSSTSPALQVRINCQAWRGPVCMIYGKGDGWLGTV